MDIICPKCGAKSSEKEFLGAFCTDCHGFNFRIPKQSEFKIVNCKRCDKVLFKGEWHRFNEHRISEAIEKKCRGEFESVEYDYGRGALKVCFRIGNKEKCLEQQFLIEKQNGICPDCSRMSGGYYEAIVQLRGDNMERLRQYASSMEKRLKEKTFVSKVEEKKDGGIDMYIGNSKAVVADLHTRRVKAIMSSKLFGRDKEGRNTYRTTFLIRI